MVDSQLVQEPVVQGSVVLELQCADGVRYPLERIGYRVRVVVHRIDAPVVAGAVVRGPQDPVDDRIPHVEVGRCHIDLRPQCLRAVGKIARPHPAEQRQVLLRAARAPGALPAGLRERTAILLDLVGAEVADVGPAVHDELLGELVQPPEVIGGEEEPVVPVEAQPAYVVDDRVYELDLLLRRVRVVEAEVAQPTVLPGDSEVQADRLCMADVQVAVGLRREACVHSPSEAAAGIVLVDDVADEIAGGGVRHLSTL